MHQVPYLAGYLGAVCQGM